jgi:uncharacterized protein (DUF2235 family)
MTKRLAVFCDGTWNTSDQKRDGQVCPTNVSKLKNAVMATDSNGMAQVAAYQKGVGTKFIERLRGGAFGWGLSRTVQQAYRFIVERYEEGDEIFLFGFSRGAYTARSVGGLIRNCGVLKREHAGRVDEAYKLYRRRDPDSAPSEDEAKRFRQDYSHEPNIAFMGVWDTVGTLGIPGGIPWIPSNWLHQFNKRWSFHDVKLSRIVERAYQALAIDERRQQFEPALWEQQPGAGGQVLEQVWFAGAHSNVGGGYPDSGLSDIALRWMADKAVAAGLALDEERLGEVRPNCLGTLYDSRSGLFRLLPAGDRRIGPPVGAAGGAALTHESVHESAIERSERFPAPGYRSKTVEDYLQRQPAGRVAVP